MSLGYKRRKKALNRQQRLIRCPNRGPTVDEHVLRGRKRRHVMTFRRRAKAVRVLNPKRAKISDFYADKAQREPLESYLQKPQRETTRLYGWSAA